jgi:hypothetical protein
MQNRERLTSKNERKTSYTRFVSSALLLAAGGLALPFAFVGCAPTNNQVPAGSAGTAGAASGAGGNGGSAGTTVLTGGSAGTTVLTGGTAGMSGSSSGGTGGEDCAATSTPAKLIPLDLYVITDSSKSMLETTSGGITKWEALKAAMTGFFSDATADGLSVALKFFPDEQPAIPAACTDDTQCGAFGPCDQRKACVTVGTFSKTLTTLCTTDADCTPGTEVCVPVQRCDNGAECSKVYCVSSGPDTPCTADCVPFDGYCRSRDVCTGANYSAPVVDMGQLPAASQPLIDALNARSPDGFTPTGPALTGALEYAVARQNASPGRKVAVVLVTDGLPGGFIPGSPPPECTPGDVVGVGALISAGATGTPAIPTFVIGVFGPCDLIDQNIMPQANLDTWAVAGGTTQAVLISTDQDVTQQLRDALSQVRTKAIACQYSVPANEDGALDFGKVNVQYASGAMPATTIGYVGGVDDASCDPALGGWHYNADPKAGGTPTEIIVCPQTCAQLQAVADVHVDIAYGCTTIEIR